MDSRTQKILEECAKDSDSLEKLKEVVTDLENRAEEAQNNLRLLEAAIRTDYDSILITTLELEKPGPRIVYVNEGFCKMTGYSREEVIGKTPRILQGPKTDRATLDRLKRQLKEGHSFFGQAVNYRKDGSEFIMQWDIHPLTDEEGNITHWVSYQHDITERKRAEKTVVDTHIEFDELDEESKRTLVDVDEQGNIVYANKAFRELIGYDRDELIQNKLWDLMPRKFKNSMRTRFEEPLDLDQFDDQGFKVMIKHKTGVPIQVEINTKVLHLQEQPLIRGDIKNLSLQKRILRTLSQRNTDFERIFEKKSDFSYRLVIDENNEPRFEFLSGAFPELTGFNINQVKRKGGWDELIHPDDQEKVREHIDKVLKGTTSTEEYRIKQSDGHYRKVLDYAKPLWSDEDHEVVGVKGSINVHVDELEGSDS